MTKADHRHTPSEEREIREAALDETIEGSFPASDPPSSIPNPDDHEAMKRRDDHAADGNGSAGDTSGRAGSLERKG